MIKTALFVGRGEFQLANSKLNFSGCAFLYRCTFKSKNMKGLSNSNQLCFVLKNKHKISNLYGKNYSPEATVTYVLKNSIWNLRNGNIPFETPHFQVRVFKMVVTVASKHNPLHHILTTSNQ